MTTVLLYHDVIFDNDVEASGFAGAAASRYKLRVQDFRGHLERLRACEIQLPQRQFLLTFDDGGRSAIRTADLLDEIGWRGHFFITAAYIGDPKFVSRTEVADLFARGHGIGTHSWSHPDRMSSLSIDQLLVEWRRSADCLSDIVGKQITTASVPGGYFADKVAEAASAAGVTTLFTSEPVRRSWQIAACEVRGRFTVWNHMPPQTAANLVLGHGGDARKQWLYWNFKKIAKRAGGRAWLQFRDAYLRRRVRAIG